MSGRSRGGIGMSDTAETTATRLWRDRALIREQERNEAQVRASVIEEKLAALAVENDRLASKNSDLRTRTTGSPSRSPV
jgi:hypothetical protein